MECTYCKNELDARLGLIHTRWECKTFIDNDTIGSALIPLDNFYHGIFQKIPKALKGEYLMPLWLLRNKPEQNIRLYYHFIDAPLPRVAACDRLSALNKSGICPLCNSETRIIIINWRFYVLFSHILAALGEGESAQEDINFLFHALHQPEFDYSIPAPYSVNRDIVYAGFGLVLGHEFGHLLAVKGNFEAEVNDSMVNIPSTFRTVILGELDADRMAIRILTAALIAKNPLDKDTIILPFIGAELVLRIISLLEKKEDGSPVDFDKDLLLWNGYYPYSNLRWRQINKVGCDMGELGLLNFDQWHEQRTRLFSKWGEITKQINKNGSE